MTSWVFIDVPTKQVTDTISAKKSQLSCQELSKAIFDEICFKQNVSLSFTERIESQIRIKSSRLYSKMKQSWKGGHQKNTFGS